MRFDDFKYTVRHRCEDAIQWLNHVRSGKPILAQVGVIASVVLVILLIGVGINGVFQRSSSAPPRVSQSFSITLGGLQTTLADDPDFGGVTIKAVEPSKRQSRWTIEVLGTVLSSTVRERLAQLISDSGFKPNDVTWSLHVIETPDAAVPQR